MAITRKSRNLLPSVFQTDTNEKFLTATVDQLISEPVLTNLNGYIGRKFTPTFKQGDSYITESTASRQDYQLESSVVVKDDANKISFFSTYVDYLNKLKYYGALTDKQSRMFSADYYTYDPHISIDKFVNFSQYYWLPNGPDAVEVSSTGLELEVTYNVTRDSAKGTYVYSSNGAVDSAVTLPRGGTYKFVVDQPGFPFWIQTELGTDGVISATPTLSSRDVLGVDNNGTDSGTITFTIPQTSAQDRFVSMSNIATVDYATPARYSDWENQTVSQFQSVFPQWAGIIGQVNGKQLIFVNQDQYNNEGDAIWTAPDVIDPVTGNIIPGYDSGTIVSDAQRFGIWKVQLLDIGVNDPLIRLVWVRDVSINQKVFIRYGVANAGKEYYKDYDGFLHQMPVLSSLLDTLYAQDGVDGAFNTTFKVVDYAGWNINAETDIIGQKNYTSPNGVQFTSGLKVLFGTDVTPATYQNKLFYVEGVGDVDNGIRLVPVDELVTPEIYNNENSINFPGKLFPDYITINRASLDRNAWSRNNRWFHQEVILATANYNGVIPVFDQLSRARRPIIQFDANMQLINNGRIGKLPVDVLDLTTKDAFTDYEGTTYDTAFGVALTDGMRIIFAADIDPRVQNKIYVINLVQYELDSNNLPTGQFRIKLVPADDGDVLIHDTVVITAGLHKGSQWWFDGINWNESQQKTSLQQSPLFDVFDSTFDFTTGQPNPGKSISTYNRSNFIGTKLFGYSINSAGVNDSVLGFPLTYRNFNTQGDIEFSNYFTTDVFDYTNENGFIVENNISFGFLQKIQDRYTLKPVNVWQKAVEQTKQYQSIGYVYDGTSDIFLIDVTPNTQSTIPYVKVFKNFIYLRSDQWVLVENQIRLTTAETFIGDGTTTEFRLTTVTSTVNGVVVLVNNIPRKSAYYYSVTGLIITFVSPPNAGDLIDIRVITPPSVGDKIDILVYSDEVSELGFYQVPQNLDLNAQNTDISTLTLGQLRNHAVALGQNSTEVVGDILGSSNLRDIDIKQQGGTILQHAAPLPYGELFLSDKQANFVDALQYAQREYSKFKNKFLELSASTVGIDPTDPVASVDLIMTELNKIKNSTFPWFYSDMIPYGTLKNTINYTVFDPLKTDYELTSTFIDTTLSNTAILIYLNRRQLINGLDYQFRTDRPAVTMLMSLAVDDVITIIEYPNTNGSFVPETPTKLGLWPKYIPEIFLDDTYRNPINVIRGHDGSITPAFNDYRDGFLLELEQRIYNNIKLPDIGTYVDILSVVPGKFRKTGGYVLSETNQLVSKSFQSWVGNNLLDFSTNDTFESNDLFTWNYGAFNDRIDGEALPGSWRACYQYFYDTFRPHLTPWEMLGFTTMPSWWIEFYGPGPYTSGNQLLWSDLEAGLIRYGARAGVDSHYVRPGLASIIPVDENGNLIPPASLLTASYSATRAAASWSVGQYGPTEFAWRSSSDFPYAVQLAVALARPGQFFGTSIDTYTYSPFNATWDPATQSGQFLNNMSSRHLSQADIYFNGQNVNGSVYRGAGYLNWIADYLTSLGVSPTKKLSNLIYNYQLNLTYKLAGFSDQKYLNILAEQTSPGSTNSTIVIPTENYNIYLNKSTPVQTLTYSAVIIEKTNNGYSVRGYDLNNPFFTIIPSIVNSNSTPIRVLNSTTSVFHDYQSLKVTVPYGYELISQQQVVDFLISYERYLVAQGFTFDLTEGDLGEIKNWTLSSKEFMYWAQQGWKPGSIIVLSPVSNVLTAISQQAITDGISDSQYGSRVIDQNFSMVKNVDYVVMRSANDFKVTLTNSASVIGFVKIDLVQYEHVLVFDNVTVFNDIIYKPELGNRQYRLRLQGQKTANWDGSLYAPGFIYHDGEVGVWQAGNDYLKGDLVQYKNQFYTALQDVIASTDFQFSNWQLISSSEIQPGLKPNFSTLGSEAKSYYDSYPSIDNKDQISHSHKLIGFQPRQYLSDLGLTETTQIEFYKGFIKQKGTINVIEQLTDTQFNNLTGNINLYEEYALRVGSYGALTSNPLVEVALDEKAFGVNPGIAQFVSDADNNLGDGLTIFNKAQLHKSTDKFDGTIALNRNAGSDYNNDILTAGYVNLNDVNATIFDISEYRNLNNDIDNVGIGYRIWVARDFNRDWNVYRITETNNHVTTVDIYSTSGYVTFTTNLPHGLSVGDIFIVKQLSSEFDGYHQVHSIVNNNVVTAAYSGNATLPLSGLSEFFVLNSVRFQFMEDSRIYGLTNPLNQWRVGDKIWIDDDAATTAVQGQPFSPQPSNTWKVYEKQHPWAYKQALVKGQTEYQANSGFGTSLKMSADGLVVVAGSPWQGNGVVNTFLKDYKNEFNEGFTVLPTLSNVSAFGYTVDLATGTNTNYMAVSAPYSAGNVGYVSIYSKTTNASTYGLNQVLVGDITNPNPDKFGSSLAFNQDGSWLYIGAPANNKVYLYGLNKQVPHQVSTVSVINQNIITLANVAGVRTITANVGDIITEPVTGARVVVVASTYPSGSANITVDSLNNIIPIPGTNYNFANILLSSPITASTGQYITQVSSGANIYLYRGAANNSRIYGLYQNTYTFDVVGNIAISGNAQPVKPISVGYGNLFINGVDSGLYPKASYSTSTQSSIPYSKLGFTPASNDVNSLYITNGSKVYIPGVEYTLNSGNIVFLSNIAQTTLTVVQQPYYSLMGNVSGNAGSNFGYALSSSFDGAQLAVGAPNDAIMGASGILLPAAGSVWVYDRTIEAFNSTGVSDYTTKNTIGTVYRVLIDDQVVTNYFTVGSNTIRFITPPAVGKVIYIETNHFQLLEKLIGIDSLEGGLGAIQANTYFGTSLTICSNNCAIYVGAPNYDAGSSFNTGAVWKFHNRGRLYGTNTGYAVKPVFAPGDSIRLNNFEVTISGRLMPTTLNGASANILSLSSNVSVITGQTIGQYHGSGQWANVIVLANTGGVGSQFITVSGYTTPYTFNYGPGNVVSIGNTTVRTTTSAFPMANLDSVVKDINDANLLGVTAVNQAGTLRFNCDITVAKNQLRILSGENVLGSAGVYADADMRIFAFMQIIVNPFHADGEFFGSKVKLASNAYMLVIGSGYGTTHEYATFDINTTFDDDSTRFTDAIKGSGSVYIYELYDDPRNAVEHPGRYAYAQQLNPGNLVPGELFGYSLDIEGTFITVSAPADSSEATNAGSIYVFENPTSARGWGLIRYQQPQVDVDSVSRIFLYDNQTNTILDNLQIIDPVKGRILGQAEQNITYKTEYDPAIYNQGNNPTADINTDISWNNIQVGKVWWDLSNVRYVNYEQDTLTYRSINWGNLMPGSTVDVYEWVESEVLPSRYVAAYPSSGTPKHADNSAYVELAYVDPVTNIISSKFYFWVAGNTQLNPNLAGRTLPVTAIADYIANPKGQGIAYAAVIRDDAVILYNVDNFLSAKNTILHIDYQLLMNTNIIHSEYELVQRGNPDNNIPDTIVNKIIDSLSGTDRNGAAVPDPKLSAAESYGIDIRPRQSMFINRLAAVKELVLYVNSVLINKPVARQFNLTGLYSAEPHPSLKLGEYDLKIATEIELDYLDTGALPTGYNVLVENDTTQDMLWVVYTLLANKTWQISRVQSYKTSLYWDFVDWFAQKADGSYYSLADKLDFVVDTFVDAQKLGVQPGEEILVRVNNTDQGSWNLLVVDTNKNLNVVGIQNGTVQFKTNLSDFGNNELGFGNQGFSTDRYDQNPNVEIRYIVESLLKDIFVGELQGEFNNSFFVMVNYLLSEQKYVDWIFKTSFISVTHNLRKLLQFPNYIQDNQTYYQSYIEEVKPYRTKLREYLINYSGDDTYQSTLTDFDLPPYYDADTKIFRSPSGEGTYISSDEALWQTYPYSQWYNNRKLSVDSIIVENPGSGYSTPPLVTIINGAGGGAGATATAFIDGNTGAVTHITVTNTGAGYITTPTVTINGSCNIPATAYVQIRNPQVRSFDTTLKFDRVSYTSMIKEWKPNTTYHPTQFDGNGYVQSGDIISHAQLDGNTYIRSVYIVPSTITTGNNFVSSMFTLFPQANIKNANDRILGMYQPLDKMPAVDVISVDITTANLSTNTNTIYAYSQDTLIIGMYISGNGVTAGRITNIISNVSFSAGGSTTTIKQITLTDPVTLPPDTTITARYDNLDSLVSGIGYPGLEITGVKYGITPLFGAGFDNTPFDPVEYSTDGASLLSTDIFDTSISSTFRNQLLGTRPEDIVIAGGEYVDRYSSHAPEEMVPGRVFDTLDMRVYTQANAHIYGYRIFKNMMRNTSYLRIADSATTTLANALSLTDSYITVANASVLPTPEPVFGHYPGVVFIGAERITYWRNYALETPIAWGNAVIVPTGTLISDGNLYITTGNVYEATANLSNVSSNVYAISSQNILGQIRRGTQGTAVSNAYPMGTLVTDASHNQELPATVSGNIKRFSNVTYHVSDTVSYSIGLSGNITANVGDTITQLTTSASATVLGFENTAGSKIIVSYNNGFGFALMSNTIVAASNIAINGLYTGNIYPISSVISGNSYVATDPMSYSTVTSYGLNAQGNVIVAANTVLLTSNIWLNPSAGNVTATDGSGLIGATTVQAIFIKADLAILNATNIKADTLVTEDAINTLTTENGIELTEE